MIQSKQEYKYYLLRDRESSGIPSSSTIASKLKEQFFPKEEWQFIKAMRRLEYYQNVSKYNIIGKIKWIISKFLFRKISIKFGYSIPINVFGAGLSLPHRGNIIINPKTKIGENCRIHVGVNIGAHKDKAPIIGNNVYIGPGAILFGNIEIADNITIGANATVNKSFTMPNVTIAGTPAKIIKENTPSWNGIYAKKS